MFTQLQNWNGSLDINGTHYDSVDALKTLKFNDLETVHIKLYPKQKTAVKNDCDVVQEYRITVKQYMTRKATPEFDFMQRWNNNIPMPFRTMTGTIVKETRGMVYMKLHGDIWADKIHRCMKCGKVLTNPVSQYFGIGPECGNHNYVNPFDTQEELKKAVDAYKKELQNITWEGWIIRSSIIETVEV
ncbi:hypothetical protein J6O48_08825 [bacterium]|nr:hypothetical protein [bacterium]